MKLVIVSNIFGKTEGFQQLIAEFPPGFSEIEPVTPYGDETQKFGNEEEAYHKFTTEIGVDHYAKILLSKIKNAKTTDQILLGFSVGATAIWLASTALDCYETTKAICFYSSQIRNHLSVKPKFPIEFYFSKAEPKYKVDDVIASLRSTQNLKCHKTNYLHGFMNKESVNYSAEAYSNYIKIIKNA